MCNEPKITPVEQFREAQSRLNFMSIVVFLISFKTRISSFQIYLRSKISKCKNRTFQGSSKIKNTLLVLIMFFL